MDGKNSELSPRINKYEELSPSQLRGELEEVILSFPDTGTGFVPFDKMDEQKAKHETSMRLALERKTSGKRADTFSELRTILAKSPTTNAFQEMVLNNLGEIYDRPFGFSKKDLDRTKPSDRSRIDDIPLVLILGRDPSIPEGAFPTTPEKAYELECRYYDAIKFREDLIEGVDNSAFSRLYRRVKAPGNAIGIGRNKKQRIENAWKKESVAKYGKKLQRIPPPTT